MILIPQCLCKTKPNHWEIVHPWRLKKCWLEVTIKMVVFFFCNFDAIGAMVLLISSKLIELESCAWAQIEALEA